MHKRKQMNDTTIDVLKDKIVGHFEYQLIDVKTNKVVKEYSERNTIMKRIHKIIFDIISDYKYKSTFIPIPDIKITTFALGNKGIFNDKPKKLTGYEKKLNAELISDGYVYQGSWNEIKSDGIVDKSAEGDKRNFNGMPIDEELELGLKIHTRVENQKITFETTLGQLTGVGIKFSEAGLYINAGKDLEKGNLGTLFAMRTFDEVEKTDACVLKMKWVIIFPEFDEQLFEESIGDVPIIPKSEDAEVSLIKDMPYETIMLPQFTGTTSVTDYIRSLGRDITRDFVVINNITQPTLKFDGNKPTKKEIIFVNNGSILGTDSGDDGLIIGYKMTLLNNGIIRGAGGEGATGSQEKGQSFKNRKV